MAQKLPEEFQNQMKRLLGEAGFFAYLNALDEPYTRALRINLLLRPDGTPPCAIEGLGAPVPWAKGAYFIEGDARPGLSPLHEGGLFYMQEPSALTAVTVLDPQPGERVLDLCAGSGCIGLAVAKHVPGSHVVLGELDEGALRVCRQNIRRTGLSGQVVSMQLNALEKAPARLGEFDCIVSNPPYIPDGDIAGLDASVRDYEPHLALKGGADGLDFYRAICAHWREALRPGGRLYFEVGIGQADDVLRIMRAVGFGDIEVIPDLNDIPRVVWGILHTEI